MVNEYIRVDIRDNIDYRSAQNRNVCFVLFTLATCLCRDCTSTILVNSQCFFNFFLGSMSIINTKNYPVYCTTTILALKSKTFSRVNDQLFILLRYFVIFTTENKTNARESCYDFAVARGQRDGRVLLLQNALQSVASQLLWIHIIVKRVLFRPRYNAARGRIYWFVDYRSSPQVCVFNNDNNNNVIVINNHHLRFSIKIKTLGWIATECYRENSGWSIITFKYLL